MQEAESALWRVGLVLVGLLLIVGIVAIADYDYTGSCNSPYDTVYPGPHTIKFCGRTYDSANDTSTWYYSVTSGSSPAISHWVLGLCAEHSVVDAGPGIHEVGTDPPKKGTGIYGIKWEQGFTGGDTCLYWVTLNGNWEVDYVEVGIKAGQDVYGKDPRIYIRGPSCIPFVAPQITVTADWGATLDVDQPMIAEWAASPVQFTKSFGELEVTVTATACYALNICYTYAVDPVTSGLSVSSGDMPLSFEYPTGSGTWTPIPPEGGTTASLPAPSGIGTNIIHTYPIRIDLALLEIGDLAAGDSITFTLHVNVADGAL